MLFLRLPIPLSSYIFISCMRISVSIDPLRPMMLNRKDTNNNMESSDIWHPKATKGVNPITSSKRQGPKGPDTWQSPQNSLMHVGNLAMVSTLRKTISLVSKSECWHSTPPKKQILAAISSGSTTFQNHLESCSSRLMTRAPTTLTTWSSTQCPTVGC